MPCLGYILQEPTPLLPLDTARLVPLLQANGPDLIASGVKQPLSLLTHLTSLPLPPPYKLPSGDVIKPPEPSDQPARKLVILGDCSGSDNARFLEMCMDPSMLVHECTNAAIRSQYERKKRAEHPPDPDPKSGSAAATQQQWEERQAIVKEKAVKRGHSTPTEVGQFSRTIRARRLIINHFSTM